ncbi:MAG: chemotaxis protein CheX [Wolinella sp.]
MKPVIIQDVAIYYSESVLDSKEAKAICDVLTSSAATFRSIQIKALFFSFEKTEQFEAQAITTIAKTLLAIQNKLEVVTAICGYNDEQFRELKEIFPNKSIPLFKTVEMAMLFLGVKIPRNAQSIVLYDSDDMTQTIVSQELSQKGFKVHTALNEQDFERKKKELGNNAVYIYDIAFDVTGNYIPVKISQGIVTYQLYEHLDAKLSVHFSAQAHAARIAEGYKVFVFEARDVKSMNLKVIDFFVSLALNVVQHGALIAICGMSKDIIALDVAHKMERSGIRFFENDMELAYDSSVAKLARSYVVKRPAGLTKRLVSQLPIFINASLETLTSLTGGEAQKRSHKITQVAIEESSDLLGAMISFEGDVSGALALAFKRSIAKEAALMMLGEEAGSDDELLDVVSEFTNIIAGRSKALLAEHDITISISLPKTCKNFTEIINTLGNRQGVQIDLLLNNKPLYLFLTH